MRKIEDVIKTTADKVKLQNDWDRQWKTAAEIGNRHASGLHTVILADEVGMGKTYVAMATMAHTIFQSKKNDRKVLLVVPPNIVLAKKWEQEIRSFNENYLPKKKSVDSKQLRPLVVKDYWELIQNLHDYENFDLSRVSNERLALFAKILWNWCKERNTVSSKAREWDISAVYGDWSPKYLNFCSECSPKAAFGYFDHEFSLRPHAFNELIQTLRNSGEANRELRDHYVNFGKRQDFAEANVYIIGMATLRKQKMNSSRAKLLTTYAVSLALKGTRGDTREQAFKVLKKCELGACPADLVEGKKKHLDWFLEIGQIDLWGMRSCIETVLEQEDWQYRLRNLHESEKPKEDLKTFQQRVIQEKLSESGIQLAIVDEVHNWKNEGNGALEFQKHYAPVILNKLLMSATPFQLDEKELGKIFDLCACNSDESLRIKNELLSPLGCIPTCISASDRFAKSWSKLHTKDLSVLKNLFEREQSLDLIITEIEKFIEASEELLEFSKTTRAYFHTIQRLQSELGKLIIRHTKDRDKRHFHVGQEYVTQGVPNYAKPRRTLYEINGRGDNESAFLSYLGMRVDQMVRRDTGSKGYESNARLLGGITSSNAAFKDSNKELLTRTDLTGETKTYLNFFSESLDKATHPKVKATVERVMDNYRQGIKTLIFCERLPTQKEIIAELDRRILHEVFGEGGVTHVKEKREALLKEYLGIELYWSRSILQTLKKELTSRQRADVIQIALVNANQISLELGIQNQRQANKLLDLCLFVELPISQISRNPFLTLLQHKEALQQYLRIKKVNLEIELDDDTDDSIDYLLNQEIADSLLESPSIWYAVQETKSQDDSLHQRIWKLMDSEFSMLQDQQGNMDATVVASLMIELGQGLRKILLRLDCLRNVTSVSGLLLKPTIEMLRETESQQYISPWHRTSHYLQVLADSEGTIRKSPNDNSKRQSLWKGVRLRESRITSEDGIQIESSGIVRRMNGSVDADSRVNVCAAFNSPLLPDVLVCTAIGSEGIDLHMFCDEIIHHDMPWNPAKLEQRIGRLDRVGSLAERQYENAECSNGRLHIGIPFLAHNYEQFQYDKLHNRSQKFEILLGKPEFNVDVDEVSVNSANDEEVVSETTEDDTNSSSDLLVSLPDQFVSSLRIDLTVNR